MASYPFCALVAAGGTGELYSLSPVEVEQVVKVTVENRTARPSSRGPVTTPSSARTLPAARERAGAEASRLRRRITRGAPESGLIEYYRAIGAATPLPLMIYSRDGPSSSASRSPALADRVPTLTAWKDGQGDVRKYQRIMHYNGDRLAWFGGLGDDCVPAYFAIGVQGYTSSISNIAPRLSLELADAGMARDFRRLDHLMKRYVHPLYAIRDRAPRLRSSGDEGSHGDARHARRPRASPAPELPSGRVEEIRALMNVYKEWMNLAVAR